MLAVQRLDAAAVADELAFEQLTIEVRSVAVALARSSRFAPDGRSTLNLGDPREAEFCMTALATAAKQHLRRGEDLVALVERATAMAAGGTARSLAAMRIDAGLYLLRAIAMAELLHESAGPARADNRRRELADASIARLADGFVLRLGASPPEVFTEVFPRFALAVRRVPPWVRRAPDRGPARRP